MYGKKQDGLESVNGGRTNLNKQEFEDDSSSALELDHDANLPEGHEYATSKYAYSDIDELVKKYKLKGYPTSDAFNKAMNDLDKKVESLPIEEKKSMSSREYLGASLPALMDTRKKIKKGGSKSGRRYNNAKKKPFGKPYQTIEDEPRSLYSVARVSESTSTSLCDIFKKYDINVAGLLAGLAIIHERGETESEAIVKLIVDAVPRPKSLQIEENVV